MPQVECPVDNCDYKTADVGDAVGAAILTHHLTSVHPVQTPAKPPKLPQPRVRGKITEDVWETFKKEWERFKVGSNLAGDNVNVFLIDCCESDLKTDVLRESPVLETKPEGEIQDKGLVPGERKVELDK